MTPDEIKKALKCCKQPVGSGSCNKCPFDYQRIKKLGATDKSCTQLMFDCVLEYINQLEAEVESITEKFECQQQVYSDLHYIIQSHAEEIKIVKSEAIKEFAEKLKGKLFYECGDINFSETCEIRRIVDNLVKETVGETDDT